MRSCYIVLGVPRSSSDRSIREAYHDRAKALHPDHAGPDAAEAFRELNEAYEVLSDPALRQRHDRELDREERQPAEAGRPPGRRPPRPEPLIPPRPHAEPLVPEAMDVLHDFRTFRPSRDALHDRWARNFTSAGAPKGEQPQPLTVEVELTPDQAARGVVVPLGIPTFRTCPRCGGGGSVWHFPCIECGQEGVVEEQQRVEIEVPAGVRPGSVFELPLEGLGIENLYLRLAIRIGR